MYIFSKSKNESNRFDNYDLVLSTNDGVSLSDLLENFKCFLQGCGYSIEGDIVISEPFIAEVADDADVS